MILRVIFAEIKKNFRQFFFSSRVLSWTLVLPLCNALYLYFLYLPFDPKLINLEFSNAVFALDPVGFTIVGQLLYSFFTMMILSGAIFDSERQQGTLESVLLSPANRVAILLGGALANAVNYVWVLIGVLVSWVAFLNVNPRVNDFSALFASIVLSYASIVVLGMCIEAFFIHSRRGIMYGTMLQEPVMFLSGLIFPLQVMPKPLLSISYLLPLTFGLISVRLTLLGGASMFDVAVPLCILLSMVVIFAVLAVWLIGYAEHNAKVRATLAEF